MSGICGILRLDGGPAEGIGTMAAFLERRGPDGTRLWQDGPVALGHTLLATTPEALHEVLPLTDPATGCTIVADARLDNREELLEALGLPTAGRVVGDGEILLRAWLSWGEGGLHRLLGDFAFLIWDPRSRALVAARDHMGMRQLAYSQVPGKVLAFATEPRAVLEAPGVPNDLDEGRIADFLEDYLEWIDLETTFYTAVKRLPPAHVLVAGPQGMTIRPYWRLEPGAPLRLGSDRDYAEAFLDVLTASVRSRLRSAGRVGAMLSGGMDSGSVVAVAARILASQERGPLPTFSLVGPDPENYAETLAIRASQSLPDLDPHEVDVGDLGSWRESLLEALRHLDEPFDGSMHILRAMYLSAREAGVRIVLDGAAGDMVLDRGDYLESLARTGRFRKLWHESRAYALSLGPPWTPRSMLMSNLRGGLVPDAVRRLRDVARRRNDGVPTNGLLSQGFADRAKLAARVRRWRDLSRSESRAGAIAGPLLVTGRERYDRIAGSFGIEPRDPYFDRRVAEFCLRCPTDQMFSNGWTKMIQRRAMQGLMPEDVIWRRGRTHLGWSLAMELLDGGRARPPSPTELPESHSAVFQQATDLNYGQVTSKPLDGPDGQQLLAAWYLLFWLASDRGPRSGS